MRTANKSIRHFIIILASGIAMSIAGLDANASETAASIANHNSESNENRIASPLQEGDLIFQISQSSQSAALREASQSEWTHVGMITRFEKEWYVAEAISTTTFTPLKAFINRGKDRRYVVKRLKNPLSTTALYHLKIELNEMMNRPYDIYFEWSEKAIYCSELLWKAYQRSNGIQIGRIQRFGEMKLDGPEVKKLIDRRIKRNGRTINLDEPIITPISMMQSPELVTIELA